MSDWKRLYAEVGELDPPARLAQRIATLAVEARAEAAPLRPPRRLASRAFGLAALGAGAALVLGLLVLAAHSRGPHHSVRPGGSPSSVVVSSDGVRLKIPAGWRAVKPASDAPVTDPRTLLVAGTAGVHAQASRCQIGGRYHVPSQGAVVVVVGWLSSSAGGGPGHPGRAALDHLTQVRKPMFECYSGRGAAAQVRLDGRDYQVNVMVGDQASPQRIAQALAVARSFDLSSSSTQGDTPDPNTVIDVTGAIGGIRTSETRASAERTLGSGHPISSVTRHPKTGTYTLDRVAYPASQLVVLYVATPNHRARVFEVVTTSPRYHTANGLHVGSTLGQARNEPGIRCSPQNTWIACQSSLGHGKPLTSFIVKDGRVVRVFAAAAAD